MKPLSMRANAAVLEELAFCQTPVVFDFDGTLAPLVTDRDRAALRPETL